MSEGMLNLGPLDGLVLALQLLGLGFLVLGCFRPSRGLRLACLSTAALAFALPLAALLLMGTHSGWAFLGLLGALLGLRAADLARRVAERWLLAGALLLAVGLRAAELGRGEAGWLGGESLLLALPWGIGLAELLFAGLLGLEERFPSTGTWIDLKTEQLRALRHAFAGLSLALLLGVLGADTRIPAGATETGALMLLVGGLLHQQRLKTWPRWAFHAALFVVVLAGLAVAFRWAPDWAGLATRGASTAFHQRGVA